MKPAYVPLRNLTEETRDYKVKVRVVHKSPAKQSPTKPIRFQKLVLKDEEGTKMHATLFNDDIESFEQALERKGEYELTGATIQTVPENMKRKLGDYQMSFNSRVKITRVNTKACTDQPEYTNLSSVIEACSQSDDIFDIIAVVIAMDDIRPVGDGQVRHMTVVDNSIHRPLTISAWNDLAKAAGEIIPNPTQGLPIIGFLALEKTSYRGVSLKTTMSTEFVVNPKGTTANMLRNWVKENSTTLHSWVTKCLALRGSSSTRVITPVLEVEKRKPNTVWQDENFWITISAPSVYTKDVFCYIGCNKCGRRVNLPRDTSYKCEHCKAPESIATPRFSFQFLVTDGEGSIRVIAFGEEAEKILNATTEEIHKQKNNEDTSELEATLAAVETKRMMLHIAPTSALTTSYVLKWVVRAVEAAPPVKIKEEIVEAEPKTPKSAGGYTPPDAEYLQSDDEA